MDPILSWGLDVVRWAQGLASPFANALMKALSFSGTELFFLILLPFIYWCVDKRRGLRLGTLLFLSTAVNLRLKLVFAQPRPYDLDPSVSMARESSFGLPSNHAQSAVVFWGVASPLFRAPWGLALVIAIPVLVGLSRIYLGVHFPTDVLAGWALGALFLGLDRIAGDRLERIFDSLRESVALAAVTAVALVMNLLTNKETMLSGAFFGFAGAAIYAKRLSPYSVSGSPVKKAMRYIFGAATLVIVYALPKLLLAEIEAAGAPPIWKFLRYALVGAWMAAGAPWLFLKLGLAELEAQPGSPDAPIPPR